MNEMNKGVNADMKVILYSDPNCPFCYALGERIAALGFDGQVEWRGVQHAPMLPIPRDEQNARFNAVIEQEVRAVQRLAPEVPIQAPTGKPNTAPAIRALAAAGLRDAPAGRAFVHAVYRALWQQNRDISSAEVLASLAAAVGLTSLGHESEGQSVAVEWARAWEDTDVGSVPLLVREDGRGLSGLVGLDVLQAFLSGSQGASV